MLVTDSKGRTFDIKLGAVSSAGGKHYQTVWIGEKADTLQPAQVASLAACADKTEWAGWEAVLAKIV